MTDRTPVVRYRDPRVTIEREPQIQIDQGAESIDIRRTPSSSFSRTGISFNEISLGGTGMILDRKLFIEYDYSPIFAISCYDLPNGGVYKTIANSLAPANHNELKAADFRRNEVLFEFEALNNPAQPALVRQTIGFNNILIAAGLGTIIRNVGPRCLGLLQAANTFNVIINGTTITTKPADYINALEWYDNHGPIDHTDYTKCASYPDNFKTYSEASFSGNNPIGKYNGNSNRSLRGSFWDFPSDVIITVTIANLENTAVGSYYCNNGYAFEFLGIAPFDAPNGANNTAFKIGEIRLINSLREVVLTKAEVISDAKYFKFVEPVVIPIFNIGEPQSRGLYGVNRFTVDVGFLANIVDQKFLSGHTQDIINNGGVDAHRIIASVRLPDSNNSAHLHYTILRPHELPELPSIVTYENKKISIQTKDIGTAYSAGVKISGIASGNLNPGSIPSRVYIYVKEQSDKTEIHDTDVFARIDRLDFQFNSGGYQFSSCSTEELYHMSREAGLKMTLPQWRDHTGSVCCIDFSKNVNLGIADYPGILGTFQFTYSVDVTPLRVALRANLAGQIGGAQDLLPPPNLVLYTVIIEEGISTIKSQAMEVTSGTIQIDPLSIPINYKTFDEKWANMYGRTLVEKLKKIGHAVATTAQKGIEYGKKAAPYIQKALPYIEKGLAAAIPLLAAGAEISEEKAMRMIHKHGVDEAVKRMKKMGKGGSMLGGKMTNKSEMAKYLRS